MTRKGVIVWQGRLLVYEPVNFGFRAQFLGEDVPQGISEELHAAIAKDQQRQAEKQEQP